MSKKLGIVLVILMMSVWGCSKSASNDSKLRGEQFDLAQKYVQSERYDEALACIDNAIASDAHVARFHETRGFCLMKIGKFVDALVAYEQAIHIDDALAEAYVGKAVVLEKMGRYEDALKFYTYAIRLDNKNITAMNNKGLLLGKLGFREEAIDLYEQIHDVDPKYVAAYTNEGFQMMHLDRYTEAVPVLETAVRLDKKNYAAFNNLAWALLEVNDFSRAQMYGKQALEINPHGYDALVNMGVIMREQGYPKDALSYFDRAIVVREERSEVLYQKAKTHVVLEQWHAAIELLDVLTEINPQDYHSFFLKGISYLELGDKENAKHNILEAYRINPNLQDVVEANMVE